MIHAPTLSVRWVPATLARFKFGWLVLGLLCVSSGHAAEPGGARVPSLDDLLAGPNIVDAAISPSGHYLAVVKRLGNRDRIVVIDRQDGRSTPIVDFDKDAIGTNTDGHILWVAWKTEDRLLFRTGVTLEYADNAIARKTYGTLGNRMFAIGRDGKNMVRLLADARGLTVLGAWDLGDIASYLYDDPRHVIMNVEGATGVVLYKVDVVTGAGVLLTTPDSRVTGWWLDRQGKPVVRVEGTSSQVRFFRQDAAGKWQLFHKINRKEAGVQLDYQPIGPSEDPGKFYVLARPDGRERTGIYLYDLTNMSFGQVFLERADFDIVDAQVARNGKGMLWHCYVTHTRVCEFSDRLANAHMRAVRKYFSDAASIRVIDLSDDNRTMLLLVDGVSQPPAYFTYDIAQQHVALVGEVNDALAYRLYPTASTVTWKAADGLELSGYLIRPVQADKMRKLPLIVRPHGGPEIRDRLAFDFEVQYLAARGYAVFLPNFRGSAGLGRAFAERGYGEWGGKIQGDIASGVQSLIDHENIDAARVCIVGASFGGYAALAGVSLAPERYQCAVSTAGIADLRGFIQWRKAAYGSDSEGYLYWLKAIGDPDKEKDKLDSGSPLRNISRIKAPVLLIHGDRDGVVPAEQSRNMESEMRKAGKQVELMVVKNEGHSEWSAANHKQRLLAIDRFLTKHLQAATEGATTPR